MKGDPKTEKQPVDELLPLAAPLPTTQVEDSSFSSSDPPRVVVQTLDG